MSKQRLLKLGCMSFLMAVGACQSGELPKDPESTSTEPTRTEPLSVGPERQVELVDHVVLAFRPEGGAYVGGYQTHRASVREGAIELVPYTFDKGERTPRAPIGLETTALIIDGGLVATTVTGSRIENGTAIFERGDAVEERLRNEIDGLHQEWQFLARPALLGDLVVEVEVSGYRYASTTSNGLHFTANNDAIGVRYSHAIWISGDGAEYPIPATYESGRIRMTVPESIVERTVFPAVLDPTVSGEVAADVAVTGFTGAGSQEAAIAFDGTNYLVVWADNRNSQDADIWAARITQAGALVDTLGIQVAAAAGRQANPTVAFNGATYVVAWEDFKVTGGTDADIDAATVSTAGAVSGLPAVTATGVSETQPQIAAGGGTALLVWNTNGDVNGALHSGGFGGAFGIAATANSEIEPTVARNPGGDYLVAWSDGPLTTADLRGQFVTSGGALNGAAFTIAAAAGRQHNPSATFDGTNFDVVWTVNSAGINLFGSRVTTAGVTLDTHLESGLPVGGVAISTLPDNQELSSIACIATGCVVVWQERRNLPTTGFDIYAQRLNLDFTLAGGELVVTNAGLGQNSPAVAASAAGYFGVWQDLRDSAVNTVFGATISSAGAVGTAAPVVGGNNRESNPALGLGAGTFSVFWSDSRTFGNDIRYVRFNSGGSKLDSTALVASNATLAQLTPAASTDLGGNAFVVWSDTRNGLNKDIFGARVSMTTGVVDAGGISISTGAADQLVPDVASSGSVALAVWQDRRNGTFDIIGALINSAGAVTVVDLTICNAALDQTRPSVTFDSASGQFIVVWSDGRTGSPDIYGARVSTAGAVLDANGVLVSGAASSQFSPSVASSAAGSFAVWEDRRAGIDVFGSRLSGGASLAVLDPAGLQVSAAAGSQTAPQVATIGGNYTVVWVDNRNAQTDIFGQEVTTAGALSGAEFVVSNTADNESNVTIVAGGTNGRVAYEKQTQNTRRVQSRLLATASANGQACSGPGQCASGFCVDGFCCDTGCGGNHVPAGPKGSAVAGDCHGCRLSLTGQPNGTCAPVSVNTICRDYVSTFCDLQELCNGVTTTCGADGGRRQGLVCNLNTNFPPGVGSGVCPANAPPGPHFCQ